VKPKSPPDLHYLAMIFLFTVAGRSNASDYKKRLERIEEVFQGYLFINGNEKLTKEINKILKLEKATGRTTARDVRRPQNGGPAMSTAGILGVKPPAPGPITAKENDNG
jgi:hypothetical protein